VLVVGWSPDSAKLAIGTGDQIQIWSTPWNTGVTQPTITITGHSGISSIAWNPSGDQIASAAEAQTTVWNAVTGELLHEFPQPARPVSQVIWNTDGTKIAEANYDGYVTLWNAQTWAYIDDFFFDINREPPYNVDPVNSISWKPDSNLIAIATDFTLYIGDSTTTQTQLSFIGHKERIRTVSWSPDATRIATGGEDNTVRIWNATTGDLLQKIDAGEDVFSVSWSPDGTRLIYGTSSNASEPAVIITPSQASTPTATLGDTLP
jgi:WD40 repeat protein